MENVIYKSHHAVVTISGVIDEPMMLQLANAIQQLHYGCYYNRIELEISSPGGQVSALDYFVEVMERLRTQGVTFTTRALMSVSSAAANLVSLGDRRETSRTSTFLYHNARAKGIESVTAQAAKEILNTVDRIDDHNLDRLVRQAQNCRTVRPTLTVKDFPGSDWSVVDYLLIGSGNGQVQLDGAKRNCRKQLQRLRKHMTTCLAEENDSLLKQLYKRLCNLDSSISAGLALELRLVDGFADAESQVKSPVLADGLQVPEWASLYHPAGWLDRNSLCRHMMFLGDTGSGKTSSGILPVVGSIMAPGNRTVGCALIIDPKREIKPQVEKLRHESISLYDINIRQEKKRPVINLMAGENLSVDSDLAEDRFLEAARKILIRSASLSPTSPARVLAGQANQHSDPYWDNDGSRLAVTILALVLLVLKNRHRIFGTDTESGLFEMMYYKNQSKLLEFGKKAGVLTYEYYFVEDERDVTCNVLPDRDIRSAPNVLALANMAMVSWFDMGQDELPVEAIVGTLKKNITGGDAEELYQQIKSSWVPFAKKTERTMQCVIAHARTCFANYTDATPAKTLYFGVEPYYLSAVKHNRQDVMPVDFTVAVNNEELRYVYVFQPDLNNNDELVAKALKAAWFEAILSSRKRLEHGDTMPMAAYIADEFHRFITSDRVHGEQSFLDTCRSFGAFCVLACQSISSMEHALAESDTNPDKNKAAVSILLNNTANKLFFRSTDRALREYMNDLCPSVPDLGHVTSVRPPATLQPGECYASLTDGRFERRQLLPYQASMHDSARS